MAWAPWGTWVASGDSHVGRQLVENIHLCPMLEFHMDLSFHRIKLQQVVDFHTLFLKVQSQIAYKPVLRIAAALLLSSHFQSQLAAGNLNVIVRYHDCRINEDPLPSGQFTVS